VVGNQGGAGSAAAGLSSAVRAAYDLAAAGWDDGPGRMYARLARAQLAQSQLLIAGSRVLDLGAGTGTASAAALAAGAARVVAADIAPGMLRHCGPTVLPVAADAIALPFRDQSFDLAVAAFFLGHLDDVPGCLREIRRVCAAFTASAFARGWTHPAKGAVDEVLAGFGYEPPGWYLAFKRQTEPCAADAGWLLERAATAGFCSLRSQTTTVATGLATPAELTSWRLGMAHVAPFVATLDQARQTELRRAAVAAVTSAGAGPLEVSMLVITGAAG
jgi:SAM-dependent methyltransferase